MSAASPGAERFSCAILFRDGSCLVGASTAALDQAFLVERRAVRLRRICCVLRNAIEGKLTQVCR